MEQNKKDKKEFSGFLKDLIKSVEDGSCDNLSDAQYAKILKSLTMSDQVEDISKKVDRLFDAICGDEETGHKGIVKRIENIEKWRDEINIMKWKAIGAVCVLSPTIYYLIQKYL